MSEHSGVAVLQSMSQDLSPHRDILTTAKGGGIIFAGRLFEYASRFLFGIIVARSIGADGYGLYSLGDTTATVLAGIAMLGMSSGIVRFLPIALSERDEDRVWGTLQVAAMLVGALSLVLALSVLGLADWAAEHLFHEPDVAPVLRIISVWIPLIATARILMAATRGFKQMQYQVYADSIAFSAIRIALTVLFLSLGLGVLGVSAAYAVAGAIEVGLLICFLNRLFPLRRPLRPARYNVRELVSFSLPVCLTQLVRQFGGNFELLLLGILGTTALVGIYTAALRVQMVGIMLLMAVETAATPIISNLYHRGANIQLGRLYQTLTRWSLSFVLPFFVTIIFFASPILSIFGEDFEAGGLALVVITLGTLVNAGTGICTAMIVMTGHSKLSLLNSTIALILTVALNLVLIPAWGAAGAAAATAMSIAGVSIARLLQVYWLHGLWPYNRTFVKPFIATAVAAAVGFVVSRLIPANVSLFYLIFDVAALWLSYAVATVLLGLSEEDSAVLHRTLGWFGTVLARH